LRRIVNSPLFLVAAVCFFLPFITVACGFDLGEQFGGAFGEDSPLTEIPQECLETTVTGWNLVSGTSPDVPQQCLQAVGGDDQQITPPNQDSSPNVWAILAFSAALLGVGLSLIPRPVGPILAILLGVIGGVLLFVLRANVAGDLPAQARPFIEVRTEYGFWLALVFLVLAAAWGLVRLVSEGPLRPAPPSAVGFGAPEAPPAPPPAEPPPA
jgi:hypothetical protein